ncbi:hypothetical protein QJ856_gp0672 [Tupanvirus deep ocean]|uniref:Uncharacterized protein n=1 Tax=Tupanvirus soda lake TaxID=2126985 RepID=A0AC59HBU0_9VIRU|nr:hypothetical protein QJ856_gp0672 [Tupanvirus deep ocean]AUL79435.2 hypothetical protein [Tupanvirus deep ocean]
MTTIETLWNNRKEEIIDYYLCTVFYSVLFGNAYDAEGRFLVDNSRHIKPLKLLRLKQNTQDIIVIDFTQDKSESFWGCKLCDYDDIDQRIIHSTIESTDDQYHYYCNKCKESILNGYHCTKCNFDLCSKCHDAGIMNPQRELVHIDKYQDLVQHDYFCNNCKGIIMNDYHCTQCKFDLSSKCHNDIYVVHEHKLIYVDKYLDMIQYKYENCTEEYVVNNTIF